MTTEGDGNKQAAEWFMDRLVSEGIRPYVQQVAEILARGQIPVVAFEPTGRSVPALEALGWMNRAVFGASLATLTRSLSQDEVTRGWLTRARVQGEFPILVVSHLGSTLLVNYAATGFSIEPGSLNSVLL
jgi:hypothetical protein